MSKEVSSLELLEPSVVKNIDVQILAKGPMGEREVAIVVPLSCAISLRRIADSMETLVGKQGQMNMNEIMWQILEQLQKA